MEIYTDDKKKFVCPGCFYNERVLIWPWEEGTVPIIVEATHVSLFHSVSW